MLREIALLHAGDAAGPEERIRRARELYAFLAPWAEDRPDAYGAVLAHELERLRRLPTAVLAHDDLGPRYEPVWLRDVAAHAAGHGLRYLADAEPSELWADRRPPGVDAQLDALAGGDRVTWEQYGDLLAGRAFRQTLLCRAGAPVDDVIDPARLARLWLAALDGLEADGDPALGQLARARPRSLAFTELDEPDTMVLWRAFRAGQLELSAAAPRHVPAPGERPEASPVARWQAARGPELTNLRHDPVRLDDPLGLRLVTLCDGTRDRAALLDGLLAAAGAGAPRERIAAGLEPSLRRLAALAMLRA
jgi:hypothetical protein